MKIVVTQADMDAWERYGPAIFHCDMTGPEALARHRIEALEQAAKHDTPDLIERAYREGHGDGCSSTVGRSSTEGRAYENADWQGSQAKRVATAIRNLQGEG